MLSQKERTAAARPTPNRNEGSVIDSLWETSQLELFLIHVYVYTFKHRSQFPHAESANRSVLTEGAFQQKQRDPSKYQSQKVWNQEGPYVNRSRAGYRNVGLKPAPRSQLHSLLMRAPHARCYSVCSCSGHTQLNKRGCAGWSVPRA